MSRGRGMAVQAPWILRLWRPFRGRLALIATGQLVSTGVAVSLPLILKTLFDGLSQDFTLPALERAVWLYFGIATVDWLMAGGLVLARGTMNVRFEWEARQRAYDRLVHLGPAFFQKHRTGDLVTRLTDDVAEKLCWFVCSGVFRALSAVFIVLFGVAMMLRLDPWLTLFTAGPLPILIVLFIRTGTVLDRRFDEVQGRISDLNAGLEACFSGVRVVKSYGREGREIQSFVKAARACRASEIEAAKAQTLVNSLYGQMWQLGVVAVLLFGGMQVMGGRLSLGAFIAFDAYVLMLIFPMLDIGTFFVKGWQSAVSIARVREIEEAPVEVAGPAAGRTLGAGVAGSLEIESVSCRYAGGREALESVSLRVGPGERVAVAGAIGSGKSTLLRLLPRLMDPVAGRILFEGTDLRDWDLGALRRRVAYVPQEPILLSGTIRENVRFDRAWVGDEAVSRAVAIARLESDLAQLSRGLETRVGVRGVSLSGGQKQRVALARAIAGDPLLLVMDDPTAALDAETEAALWAQLESGCPGLTTLVVTHRCSTLELADRILVLEGGRAVDTGSHAELSRRGGAYVSLYRRHLLEERLGRDVPDPLQAGRD